MFESELETWLGFKEDNVKDWKSIVEFRESAVNNSPNEIAVPQISKIPHGLPEDKVALLNLANEAEKKLLILSRIIPVKDITEISFGSTESSTVTLVYISKEAKKNSSSSSVDSSVLSDFSESASEGNSSSEEEIKKTKNRKENTISYEFFDDFSGTQWKRYLAATLNQRDDSGAWFRFWAV
eukprot:GHVP01029868.1.p1 GENE.GHVP01029868.1~~GHVP01029868.1.p1  ORF type:complete len:182 (-),score=46.03 GHVP01029868.1:315-860(-)